VDGIRRNDLTLTALGIFKRNKDRLLIPPPPPHIRALVTFLKVLVLNLKKFVAWYRCEFLHEGKLKGELL
jgi:hypothetical protein